MVPDVVMIQMGPLVTPIALGIDSPMQVHQGNRQTDADGPRKAPLLFTPGTCGSRLLPDRTTQECEPASKIHACDKRSAALLREGLRVLPD